MTAWWQDLMKRTWAVRISDVAKGFMKHDDMSLAAAVAFYTAFSFAPLVLLLTTLGGFLGDATQHSLLRFFEGQLGPRAGEVTTAVIESAEADSYEAGSWKWIFGVILLLVSASAVFGQLQSALNTIWETEPRPGSGIWLWLRKRLLSLGMVLTALFILLVSLVLSSFAEQLLPAGDGVLGRVVSFAASFVVSTLLFAAIYRVLPDVAIGWREVWRGAAITGVLFCVGKLALGIYLERSGMAESYGKAAGAVVALLVWVYYSCIILFVGAEYTRQHTGKRGDQPSGNDFRV